MPSPTWPSPSPDMAVVILAARTRMREDAAAALSQNLASRSPDWAAVLSLAHTHDVFPFLYHALAAACPQQAPPAVLASLRDMVRVSRLRSLAMTAELITVLRAFADAGLAAMPHKGPYLAQLAYGDVSIRHLTDLDILVRPRDVAAARRLLERLGYRLTVDCQSHEEAYVHLHHHLTYVHGRTGTLLELHWRLAGQHFALALSFDELWQRRMPLALGGVTVEGPSYDDTLLLACIHGSMHGWKQLRNVCDVAELVQPKGRPLDWDAVWRRARAWGGERMVAIGLLLAEHVLGLSLSSVAGWEERRCNAVTQELAVHACSILFGETAAPDEADMRSFFRYHYRLRERRRDRAEEVLRRVFIPTMLAWESLHVPPSLRVLHYVIRPLRLIRRYVHRLLTNLLPCHRL